MTVRKKSVLVTVREPEWVTPLADHLQEKCKELDIMWEIKPWCDHVLLWFDPRRYPQAKVILRLLSQSQCSGDIYSAAKLQTSESSAQHRTGTVPFNALARRSATLQRRDLTRSKTAGPENKSLAWRSARESTRGTAWPACTTSMCGFWSFATRKNAWSLSHSLVPRRRTPCQSHRWPNRRNSKTFS